MGQSASAAALEESIERYLPGTGERFVGLENLGQTCYAGAVLQVLLRLLPLRSPLLQWDSCLRAARLPPSSLLLPSLSSLFHLLATGPRVGSCSPAHFLRALRTAQPSSFPPLQQHDAHEFFSFLVNNLAESAAALQKNPPADPVARLVLQPYPATEGKTFVHHTFEGMLQCETECHACGAKTRRMEPFFDLSLDIPTDGCSVNYCLKHFAKRETIEGFHCESEPCTASGKKQVADRYFQLVRLPQILVLHLKRFRFDPASNRYIKLTHRIPFSLEYRDPKDPETLFRLKGLVIHIGQTSLQSGHYVSACEVEGHWFLFNDEEVKFISSSQLASFYGGSMSAYMLFYELQTI